MKLVDKKAGGNHSGSWVHPDLAIQLAQWISPAFAIQVSRWIRELILTGSVQLDTKKTDEELIKVQLELQTKNKELEESKKELKEKEEKLQRLHILNIENLTFKKKLEKNETIYIVSTYEYTRQGIFKVGRTKTMMKKRNSGHNNTHCNGDKVNVLASYKVNDAILVERNIHSKLAGLATKNDTEMFMCPFDLLNKLINLIINCDEQINDAINTIIDTVYDLRTLMFDQDAWTSGLDMSIFGDNIKIIYNDEEIMKFDIRDMNEEEKQQFIDECVKSYKAISNKEAIVWTVFQEYLHQRMSNRKNAFKPGQWRPYVVSSVKNNELTIKWKK